MFPRSEIPEEGLFGPDSMIWRVAGERVTVLGGTAATILQTAHPKVGRGVEEHSDFRNDALGRLERTLAAIYAIAYGNREEVEAMERLIAQIHGRVHGKMPDGESYSAFDPELQLWVVATLVMTATHLYEEIIHPLTLAEKQRYLDDMRLWGEFFGLDRTVGPQSWEEFRTYYEGMLSGPLLGSDPVSRDLAAGIIRPWKPWWLPWTAGAFEFLAVEQIPSPLRERLGLRSTAWTRLAWRVTRAVLRRLHPWLPRPMRLAPECRRAWDRAAAAAEAG